ncbi:hypothetical protein RhiirB3_452984 [Rhizophagus irregularis]|nr:hypothetical protein RhiirB3_452984 [Rhizophagus irregularis]
MVNFELSTSEFGNGLSASSTLNLKMIRELNTTEALKCSGYLFRPPSFKSLTSSTSLRLKKISGYGPVDFAIDLLQTAKTVSVTEIWSKGPFLGIWKSENEEFHTFHYEITMSWTHGLFLVMDAISVVSSSGFFRYRYLWISLDVNPASNLGLIMDSVPGSQVHFERKFQTTIG